MYFYGEYKNGMPGCIRSDEDAASAGIQKFDIVRTLHHTHADSDCYTKGVFTVHF